MKRPLIPVVALLSIVATVGTASAQVAAARPPNTAVTPARPATAVTAPEVPPDYVIGPEDILSIVFWRDKDISADVAVRPDGRISLPLLNDVQASGLTPLQLRQKVTEEARQYVEDPNVTVVVKQINSKKVFITGEVAKPGPYLLTGPTSVLQMLAIAGGLREYADEKNIIIMRTEAGRTTAFKFNYADMAKRKNLKQNIELKPGDTIIIP